ncbi:MAG: class I SAM-dependent methyltransferase [Ginsengibacter sp.]
MLDKVKNYDLQRAVQYDEESVFDKGNRTQHAALLQDILSYKGGQPNCFLELGCGTGYFSSVILDSIPIARGVLIDGSAEMIDMARQKLGSEAPVQYIQCLLQDVDWTAIPRSEFVFSALTIHHLSEAEKRVLYAKIYQNINDGGRFIYFDQFKTGSEDRDLFLEYLACKDIQRRLTEQLGLDLMIKELEIEEIIKKDRLVKASENDQEANISQTILHLEHVGFTNVTVVYQEARFFAIVAFK